MYLKLNLRLWLKLNLRLWLKLNLRLWLKKASERLNLNNTVQAKRSAVTDSQHLAGVSERRDIDDLNRAFAINKPQRGFDKTGIIRNWPGINQKLFI